MQIKFLSAVALAFLFATVSTAPTSGHSPVPGSGNEVTFAARVEAIQQDPEVRNTLDFLIQQIAAKLNEGSN
jgi:hypothetical protein